MIEQSHYLYRQYAADGTLLYIGVTIDPKSRLVAHRSASSWGKAKARAANVARVRVVSGVRFGSRAKAAPDVQYIDGVKYIRPDAIGLTPSQIKPELPQ